MAVADDLDQVAELCRNCARRSLDEMMALGPKPKDQAQSLLWEQQEMDLQSKVNRLTALVSKLTAGAVLSSLKDCADDLNAIGNAAQDAQDQISKINQVSDLLGKLAQVLDLGLAILAAAASPSPGTIGAAVSAAKALATGQGVSAQSGAADGNAGDEEPAEQPGDTASGADAPVSPDDATEDHELPAASGGIATDQSS